MKKILLFLVFVCVILFFSRIFLAGWILEPVLEKTLSKVFDLPVRIDELRADVISGHVRASRILIENKAPFIEGLHLDISDVRFDVDFFRIRQKEVLIQNLDLNRLLFVVDRIRLSEQKTNNVKTWYRHMKALHRKSQQGKPPGKKWVVQIDRISIHDGTFIFRDRSLEKGERKFVFRKLYGSLEGFRRPSDEPSYLSQTVKMEGLFGDQYPAPFWIEGRSNFATTRVSFDLKGEIPEGNLLQHEYLWEGLPVDIQEGRFRLKTAVQCVEKQMESQNEIVLESLKVVHGRTATDKIWGLPVLAWISFVQEQEAILLDVDVRGDISDPQFEGDKAFRKAFQKALQRRTQKGIEGLTAGSIVLANKTRELVEQTQTKLSNGLEKISSTGKEKMAVPEKVGGGLS